MKHIKLFENFSDAPITYVYAIDDYGNVNKKAMVGTHQHGKGFTPNDLGKSMGLASHPTSIPNGTAMDTPNMEMETDSENSSDNGDGDIYYSEDSMGSDDI